ncbi:hypothetical protein [Sphingomonas glacialis]|uniref:hypothetical protein n=1 Tax=Sphingomonas glacialis TaxID=658225 RepID=UPI001679D758|nr:hypothetical protein [Sphingomonas glacialis]
MIVMCGSIVAVLVDNEVRPAIDAPPDVDGDGLEPLVLEGHFHGDPQTVGGITQAGRLHARRRARDCSSMALPST